MPWWHIRSIHHSHWAISFFFFYTLFFSQHLYFFLSPLLGFCFASFVLRSYDWPGYFPLRLSKAAWHGEPDGRPTRHRGMDAGRRSLVRESVACCVHPSMIRFAAAFNGAIHRAPLLDAFSVSRRHQTRNSFSTAHIQNGTTLSRLGVQW